MTRVPAAAVLALLPFALPAQFAQAQGDSQSKDLRNHVITVLRNGTVFAKPDVGILTMNIHSSSPIADEAVADNGRKAEDVEKALTGLGFSSDNFKLTSVVIGQPAGPRMYVANDPPVATYEASQYVYVFFQASDLSDMAQLTQKTASVIEALRKAGATPADISMPGRPLQAQGGIIVYTVKDSDPYEKQALEKAMQRARDAADDIAKEMNVQIIGIHDVQSSALGGNYMPHSGLPYLQGLPYLFYSTRSDEVEISVNATVDYDFKQPRK